MITIRKYPNRRLYDTATSQYVNLEFIRELVLNHKDFKVVDSKTDEDLTKAVLLQIITEQETTEEQSLLTNTVLKQLIRFYGSDMQYFLRQYIEQSLATFIDRQESLHKMMKELINPKDTIKEFGDHLSRQMSAFTSLLRGEKSGKD